MERKFVTAINCMDGRIQKSVFDYLTTKYRVPYVDMITEPGPNKILADNKDTVAVESIKKRVELSIKKHGSKDIFLIGHEDCSGNPVEMIQQNKDTFKGMETINSMEFDVEVIGLWVSLNGEIKELRIKQ